MEQSGHAKIQVIDRAVSILEAMARYPRAVKLKIICAETGLHPSTVHRILHSLIDNGLVDRNPEGEYRLGQKFSQLSLGMHSEIDLRAVARPTWKPCATKSMRPSTLQYERVMSWSTSRRLRQTE